MTNEESEVVEAAMTLEEDLRKKRNPEAAIVVLLNKVRRLREKREDQKTPTEQEGK